jgi:hypothetical protein
MILVILLFVLAGCAKTDNWAVDRIQAGDKQFDSAKLSFPTQDIVNGVDLELLCIQGKIRSYLQVHSQTIPPYQGDPKAALVLLQVGDETFAGIAFRHEGGQRVRLSENLQDRIISALKENKSVTIRLEGYKTVVSSQEFGKHFEEIQNSPIKNPFQLPFKIP